MISRCLITLFLGMVSAGLIGCSIRTPEINGVVLDEQTKQPVKGAWVRAFMEVRSKTVGGEVHRVLSVDNPHTRTNNIGSFVIPPKSVKKPLPPASFGMEIESFDINAKTIDRIGGIQVELRNLKKKRIEVTIYIRSDKNIYEEQYQKYLKEGIKEKRALELIERDYFSSLQSLYNYCLSGRSNAEVPPAEGGCDQWELDYAIAKHERYLKTFRENVEKEVNTVIFDHLSYLYERKGDFTKAIEINRQCMDLIERRGLLKFEVWQRNKAGIEQNINRLQKLLLQKQK